MSRTILAKADGFTPVIDNVMKDTSLIAAVVFGGMWRYCQMQNGVCQATLEKIAERVGLSRGAVIEHIKTLETAGYVEDTTPDLRNRPHTYRDTGKAGLHIGLSGVHVVDSENDEDEPTVHDVYSAVHVVDSQSTPRVLEDSIKKEAKIDNKAISSKPKPHIQGIEAAIGMSRPVTQDDLPGPDLIEQTLKEFERGLHRNIPRLSTWQELAKWINRRAETEPLHRWISWYMADNFRITNAWRMTPEQVRSAWPQAFAATQEPQYEYIKPDPRESEYVPAPEGL